MPVEIQLLIAFLGGGLIGLLAGWLFGRARRAAPDSRLENEIRQQLAQRESELNQVRGQLTEIGNARAAAEASRAAAERLVAEQRDLQAKALAELRDTFKALSADALKQSAPEFLRLAEQSFGKLQESAKGDLEKRQESIKTLVEPLKQQLESYQKRLQQTESSQSTTLGEVKQQLEQLAQNSQSLARETQQFRMVLKSSQARGRWGEETLRRVIEAAGLSPHCDFREQTQAGDARPDLLVHLPGDRMIIVDAKVPDLDFLNALDSADAANRSEALEAHAAKLKATIKALADKDYPSQFANALDHVVLFLPAESLFSAALEGDRELIIWAASKRITLATPASLIALLRAVSMSWQQHEQTQNAREIADAAQELFTRVCKFTEHFESIGAGLEKANDAFNDALRSYERKIRPSGERLLKLGISTEGKSLAEPQPVQTGQQALL